MPDDRPKPIKLQRFGGIISLSPAACKRLERFIDRLEKIVQADAERLERMALLICDIDPDAVPPS